LYLFTGLFAGGDLNREQLALQFVLIFSNLLMVVQLWYGDAGNDQFSRELLASGQVTNRLRAAKPRACGDRQSSQQKTLQSALVIHTLHVGWSLGVEVGVG